MVQVNFGISNIDVSNTTQISKSVGGPDRFCYIYEWKKPRYLEHGNLEYLAYLEVNLQSLVRKTHALSRSLHNYSLCWFHTCSTKYPFKPILRSIEFPTGLHGL